uniref:Protein DBF4 homolog A n=2 Tax=Erpetoichthys calabaricus TaxID=27687 RepID=A0A8C4SUD0_ERPCA
MKPGGVPSEARNQSKGARILENKNKGIVSKVNDSKNKSSQPVLKPLSGKVFYLDLPFGKSTEILEKDILNLGGNIERFFSKDIRYLVTNKKEAKFVQCLGINSPARSPDSFNATGNSSPCPSSQKNNLKEGSHTAADVAQTSRGKSLVEKVIKEQEFIPAKRILSNALAWGVKILYVDDIKSYIERKRKDLPGDSVITTSKKTTRKNNTEKPLNSKFKAGRLAKPFLKVEDRSRHYRPLYQLLPGFPELSFAGTPPYSPFDLEKKKKCIERNHSRQNRSKGHVQSKSEQDIKKHFQTKIKIMDLKGKKKRGYCECCATKYEDINAHLEGERHKSFSKSKEYDIVDEVASNLVHNFLDKKDTKRVKCSLGVYFHAIAMEENADRTKDINTGNLEKKEKTFSSAPHVFSKKMERSDESNPFLCHTNDKGVSSLWNNHCTGPFVLFPENIANSTATQNAIQSPKQPTNQEPQISHSQPRNLHTSETKHCLIKKQPNNIQRCIVSPSKLLNCETCLTENKKQLSPKHASFLGKSSEVTLQLCRLDLPVTETNQQWNINRIPWDCSPEQKRKKAAFASNHSKTFVTGTSSSLNASAVEAEMNNDQLAACETNQTLNNVQRDKASTTSSHIACITSSPEIKFKRKSKSRKRTKLEDKKEMNSVIVRKKNLECQFQQHEAISCHSTQDLWQLFQSSEDNDYEFIGFTDDSTCSQLRIGKSIIQEESITPNLHLLFNDSSTSSFFGF